MISNEYLLNARILIVDDQKLHSYFLEKVLRQEGYKNIQCVTDPMKILSSIDQFHPDLIVLDLLMPQIDGFQIMQRLSDFRHEHYLPILALSEDKGVDIRLQALQSGATDFLNKPYENIEVLFRIRNMIEMRILHMQVEDQNKALEIKVTERTRELRDNQYDIIRRLAQAAEFRDNDTGLHIIRMSQYCAALARALGLSETQCELILNASPLHDVGKIGIPDSILLKPGPLTPEEFEIMKTHTTIGAQLLAGSKSPLMKMAQGIALTHHEKWDGSGYPHKRKGDDIPLVGQICSVCDVFDALTSERPYKKPWPVEEAIKTMVGDREKHFNPRVLDRFVEILPEILVIKNKNNE